MIMLLPAPTDQELCQQHVAGSPTAFTVLYHRHDAWIKKVMGSRLRAEDTQEIVSSTWERFARCLPNFRYQCSVKSYLYHIAINLTYNRYHYNRRRCEHLTHSLEFEMDTSEGGGGHMLHDVVPDPRPTHQDQDVEELEALIECAISRLPMRQQVMLRLVQADVDYVDMASKLRINVGTVKSRIARSREALRQELILVQQGN